MPNKPVVCLAHLIQQPNRPVPHSSQIARILVVPPRIKPSVPLMVFAYSWPARTCIAANVRLVSPPYLQIVLLTSLAWINATTSAKTMASVVEIVPPVNHTVNVLAAILACSARHSLILPTLSVEVLVGNYFIYLFIFYLFVYFHFQMLIIS